jgi:uncharacterized protein
MAGIFNEARVREILGRARTIAVLGAKDKPGPVDSVGRYLIDRGYAVVPVHPARKDVWGLPTYARLADIPGPVDVVDVFRAAEHCPGHARELLELAARPALFWMQKGIVSAEAEAVLAGSGVEVVSDACLMVDHERLFPRVNTPLAFDCRRCGHCCQGEGGIVCDGRDLDRLAGHLGLTREAFVAAYGVARGDKIFLTAKDDGYCVFFDQGCGVHPARPDICRAWPYFKGNLVDAASFEMAQDYCPGIDPDGSHADFARQGAAYLRDNDLVKVRDKCAALALTLSSAELAAMLEAGDDDA